MGGRGKRGPAAPHPSDEPREKAASAGSTAGIPRCGRPFPASTGRKAHSGIVMMLIMASAPTHTGMTSPSLRRPGCLRVFCASSVSRCRRGSGGGGGGA